MMSGTTCVCGNLLEGLMRTCAGVGVQGRVCMRASMCVLAAVSVHAYKLPHVHDTANGHTSQHAHTSTHTHLAGVYDKDDVMFVPASLVAGARQRSSSASRAAGGADGRGIDITWRW